MANYDANLPNLWSDIGAGLKWYGQNIPDIASNILPYSVPGIGLIQAGTKLANQQGGPFGGLPTGLLNYIDPRSIQAPAASSRITTDAQGNAYSQPITRADLATFAAQTPSRNVPTQAPPTTASDTDFVQPNDEDQIRAAAQSATPRNLPASAVGPNLGSSMGNINPGIGYYQGPKGFVKVNYNQAAPEYGRIRLGNPVSKGETGDQAIMAPNYPRRFNESDFAGAKVNDNGSVTMPDGRTVVPSADYYQGLAEYLRPQVADALRTNSDPKASAADKAAAFQRYNDLIPQLRNAEGAMSVAAGTPGSVQTMGRAPTGAEQAMTGSINAAANRQAQVNALNQRFADATRGVGQPAPEYMRPQQQQLMAGQQSMSPFSAATQAPLSAGLQYSQQQQQIQGMAQQANQIQNQIAQTSQYLNSNDPAIRQGAQMHLNDLQDRHTQIQNMIASQMLNISRQFAAPTRQVGSYGEMLGAERAQEMRNAALRNQLGALSQVGALNERDFGRESQMQRYGYQNELNQQRLGVALMEAQARVANSATLKERNQALQEANNLKNQLSQSRFELEQQKLGSKLSMERSGKMGGAKLFSYFDAMGLPTEVTDRYGNPTGKTLPYIEAIKDRMSVEPQEQGESDEAYFDRLGVSRYAATSLAKQAERLATNPKATTADKAMARRLQSQANAIQNKLSGKTAPKSQTSNTGSFKFDK